MIPLNSFACQYLGTPVSFFKTTVFGSAVMNPTSIHEDSGSIPGLSQWVKLLALPWAVVYVDRRCSLEPAFLWLWHRLAATAPIEPLAWEPPYATGAALKIQKKKKKKSSGNTYWWDRRLGYGSGALILKSWRGVLLWHSGLRIQCCHCSGLGHHCGTGSIPSLGTYCISLCLLKEDTN